jgi:proton-coupled amino acid transporter
MSVPSQPVNISSPRLAASGAGEVLSSSHYTPLGTPDLRALRANYVGTPPPPNIPPRGGAVTLSRDLSPVLGPSDAATSRQSPALGENGSRLVARGLETPVPLDLDELSDEDKVRVLRRHLVSKDERKRQAEAASNADSNSVHSSRPQSSNGKHVARQDTEPFPVPYTTPGADITCARAFISLLDRY